MFATYAEARYALDTLNLNVRANVCPKVKTDADLPAYSAWQDRARELNALAAEAGFVRIFDGSFKLNAEQTKLPG